MNANPAPVSGMPPMPGMSSMNSTSTMMGGGRRRRRGRRASTRKQGGGGPSTLSVPMMKGGRKRRGMTKRRKQGGGANSTLSVPMMKGGAMPAVGSKAQVWHGSARHTSGGLHKKDLMKHKGRIISRKKHALGKKALKNLVKAGYKAKKGTFKLFKRG